ncbi:glycoside hydrolase family 5 protein [Periconia macrospinosa]|uniref:Glycoside hydrolase family 5 protein n=1 Tax=Periconia macrospinosa TaxID=97972 RepID=A0A2V1EA58_9PLEO|nr:glycoside hydrolase family 5 protein [Periconia macrospinosa]
MTGQNALLTLASVGWVAKCAAADLRITADNFSFGGVNFPQLQYLSPNYRHQIIQKVVDSNARVIRLFIRGDANHTDPEPTLGEFDKAMLDRIDDTLAQIYHISKGKVKVIIAPHDAHALRGTEDAPCDAYCKELKGYFLDFYSVDKYRELYKTRLEVFFNHYPSRNFGGRPWSELSEVILGVDVQNQPWANIHPIVAGESWLCIMATYLKDTLGLGKSNIAVITGGISGPQTLERNQNFPDSALECPAVDVIGIHGYFAQKEDFSATAGTPWANLFVPGNTLTARAEKENKLLLVEEWSYMHTGLGLAYKKQAIFDQANALNHRGIPWLYSSLTFRDEGTTSRVSIDRDEASASTAAIAALKNGLTRAETSRSNFNWTTYLSAPSKPLSNLTLIPMNPYIPDRADCLFGCEGYLCDSPDSCSPSLLCKNSVCQVPSESQPGKIADACNSKKPCLSHLSCVDGACQPCMARGTIPPKDFRKTVVYNNPHGNFGQCPLDTASPFQSLPYCRSPPSTFSYSSYSSPSSSSTDENRHESPPLASYPSNPCTNPTHCSASEYCSWGLCVPCSSSPDTPSGCLGTPCRSSNKCKTGFCNAHGRCDYPNKPRKLGNKNNFDTWRSRKGAGWNAAPKGQERGPNKVWDVPVRVAFEGGEKVKETGV